MWVRFARIDSFDIATWSLDGANSVGNSGGMGSSVDVLQNAPMEM